jgi:hypothetical protein
MTPWGSSSRPGKSSDSRPAALLENTTVAVAILVYIGALAFQGYWTAGADFFSTGANVLVNTAIFAWWCVFLALFVLWRWPAIGVLTALFNLIIRMKWAWPAMRRTDTPEEILVQHGSDLLILGASIIVLRKGRIWGKSRSASLNNPG